MKKPQPAPGTQVNRPELYHALNNMVWRVASGEFTSRQDAEKAEREILGRKDFVTQTRVVMTDACVFVVRYREIAYAEPSAMAGVMP